MAGLSSGGEMGSALVRARIVTGEISGRLVAAFSYAAISPAVEAAARAAAERIKRRLISSIIETGRDLLAVKLEMSHGMFGAWIEAEFGMNVRTAQRYMGAARLAAGKGDIVSRLPAATIYALSAPSAPATVVSEVLAAAEGGLIWSSRDVKARLASFVAAARESKAAPASPANHAPPDGDAARRRCAWAEARRHRREAKASSAAEFFRARIPAADIAAACDVLRGVSCRSLAHNLGQGQRQATADSKGEP